jgi:hypothetical protein
MSSQKNQRLLADRLLKDFCETINPRGSRGLFVILRGFIDESYDKRIFVLSILVAVGTDWRWLSRDWLACIEKKNQQLRAEGRSPITRFHASECNARDKEYKGWSREEQIGFMSQLIKILGRSALHSSGWAVDMEAFDKVFPAAQRPPKLDVPGFVYRMLIKFMMVDLARTFLAANPRVRISLVHDRCDYDGMLADAFRQFLQDSDFKEEAKCYISITPASSMDVPPLQMVDLLSHENFKETKRLHKSKASALPKRRKSFKVLIKQGNIEGGVHYIPIEALRILAHHFAKRQRGNAKIPNALSPAE